MLGLSRLIGPKQAIGPGGGGDPLPTPKPLFFEVFQGLGPGNPLFELGQPVASGMQSSFLILVDFGPETIKIHDLGLGY